MMSSAERSARYRNKDVEAYRSRKAEYARTPEQRAKRAEYMRKWREENREKFNEQARRSQRKNRHKHIERNKESHLRRKFGLSLEIKRSMLEAQENRCLVCRREFSSPRAANVDHCHSTGRIRGLLCTPCNTKLGWYEAYSTNIVEYIKERVGVMGER